MSNGTPAPGLPLANQWNAVTPCDTSGGGCTSSIVGNIILNCAAGSSIAYSANGVMTWSLALNDGSTPPNVVLALYDGTGAVVAAPFEASGVDGSMTFDAPATFNEPVSIVEQLSVPGPAGLKVPGGNVGDYLGTGGANGQLAWFKPSGSGPSPILTAASLYYIATSGQTVLSLSAPDYFGNTATLTTANVAVYAGGNRIAPTLGYIVSVTNNQITLAYPAGAGETIAIDVLSSTSVREQPHA